MTTDEIITQIMDYVNHMKRPQSLNGVLAYVRLVYNLEPMQIENERTAAHGKD